MRTYLKGKDIKVPFDCLWYYFTRKYNVTNTNKREMVDGFNTRHMTKDHLFQYHFYTIEEDFDKW